MIIIIIIIVVIIISSSMFSVPSFLPFDCVYVSYFLCIHANFLLVFGVLRHPVSKKKELD